MLMWVIHFWQSGKHWWDFSYHQSFEEKQSKKAHLLKNSLQSTISLSLLQVVLWIGKPKSFLNNWWWRCGSTVAVFFDAFFCIIWAFWLEIFVVGAQISTVTNEFEYLCNEASGIIFSHLACPLLNTLPFWRIKSGNSSRNTLNLFQHPFRQKTAM